MARTVSASQIVSTFHFAPNDLGAHGLDVVPHFVGNVLGMQQPYRVIRQLNGIGCVPNLSALRSSTMAE